MRSGSTIHMRPASTDAEDDDGGLSTLLKKNIVCTLSSRYLHPHLQQHPRRTK